MFTIYSDKDIFENIISSPNDYPNWNKIINNHSIIGIDIDQNDLDSELIDDQSILFLFLQSNAREINIKAVDHLFRKIEANPETVIENPSSAYFLNLTNAEAENLQKSTGVIINCNDKIDDNLLMKSIYNHWTAEEIIPNNWGELLTSFQNFPSNSILINDRNLFTANERIGSDNINLGVNNLLRILDNILPQNLNVDYHITIQTDHQTNRNDNKQKCDQIANILNIEIRRLRPYNFIIELIFIHSSTQYYSYTHNRRLLSNYKTGSMSHCFSAFKIRTPDKTKNDDNLNINAFFDKLNSLLNCNSNLKEHRIGIQRFKEITIHCISKINQGGSNDNVYRYYLNGVEVTQGQSTIINNRLLN